MEIRFSYDVCRDYYLDFDSQVQISGNGIWIFDIKEFGEYWDKYADDYTKEVCPESVEECMQDYFWFKLNIDPDWVTFNKEDILNLYNSKEFYG